MSGEDTGPTVIRRMEGDLELVAARVGSLRTSVNELAEDVTTLTEALLPMIRAIGDLADRIADLAVTVKKEKL